MRREVKVKITISEGYEERFTKACIQVAKRRAESQEKEPDYQTLYESASRAWAFTGTREMQTYLAQADVHAPGKLRGKRLAAGLTVAALAAALGVDRHSVTAWERGTSAPSRPAIDALCELFDCDPEELGFPRIRNGLTVEERNAILMGYLEDIHKACYAVRRLMYASGTDQEDARQDATLAVLEAINRAEDPQDTESMRRYVFATIKGALLQSAKRSSDKGFTCIPVGVHPVLVSLEPLLGMKLKDRDEWN